MWLTSVALSYRIQDIKDKHTRRRGFEMKSYKVNFFDNASIEGFSVTVQATSKLKAKKAALSMIEQTDVEFWSVQELV